MSLVGLIFILVCCGIAAFLVKRAPFIDAEYKTAILWVVLVIAVLAVLWTVWCFLPLLHLPSRGPR